MERDNISKYVFFHFFLYFKINKAEIEISDLAFPFSGNDFLKTTKVHPAPLYWKKHKEFNLPILFDTDNEKEWYTLKKGKLIFNYDLLSSIFYFLSGWQEKHSNKKDHFGRFPYCESIQFQYEFIKIPIVDFYFQIIKNGIEELLNKKIDYRNPYTLFISHDIDEINTGWKEELKDSIIKVQPRKALTALLQGLTNNDPRQNISKILQLEKKANIKSTFFFLSSSLKSTAIPNADYNIKHPYIQTAFEEITLYNCEIGLHYPSVINKTNKIDIQHFCSIFPSNTVGNRHHYLALTQEDVKIFDNTSIKYDSSLGFAEQIGFRHGTSHPFYLYDFDNHTNYSTLEIPLIAMDRTLESYNYMRKTPESSIKELINLSKTVQKVNGVFSLLWHNTFLFSNKYKNWHKTFESFITSESIQNSISKTGKQILESMKK